MSGSATAEALLGRIGSGGEFELAEAALALAALDRPGVTLHRYRNHLRTLRAEVAAAYEQAQEGGLDAKIDSLTGVIFARHRYAGDRLTYDDLQNANLIRVIDRRKGLPVALGILCLDVGRAQGWRMSGLRFPGHFVLRLEDGNARAILDPFDRGRRLEAADMRRLAKEAGGEDAELHPENFEPASDTEILLRLQNNIKVRLLGAKRTESALGVVETMLLFAPKEAGLWHEAGMIHAQMGALGAAVASLRACRELTPDGAGRHRVTAVLQDLEAQIN